MKRTSVLCLENNSLLVFKATDPKSKENFYFLPGGKVQQKEDLLTCARREFLEETGLSLKIYSLVIIQVTTYRSGMVMKTLVEHLTILQKLTILYHL